MPPIYHSNAGRKPACSTSVTTDAIVKHASGWTLQAIGDHFNNADIPTPGGKPHWNRVHVAHLLKTRHAHLLKYRLLAEGVI